MLCVTLFNMKTLAHCDYATVITQKFPKELQNSFVVVVVLLCLVINFNIFVLVNFCSPYFIFLVLLPAVLRTT